MSGYIEVGNPMNNENTNVAYVSFELDCISILSDYNIVLILSHGFQFCNIQYMSLKTMPDVMTLYNVYLMDNFHYSI